MIRYLKSAIAALVLTAAPATAEIELSLYLGWQGVSDSTGSGTLPGGAPFARKFNWDGKPFDAPIYYGGRATWWTAGDFGFGVEGTHAKVFASAADLAALGLSRLEFSNGHNIFTVNAMRRWPDAFEGIDLAPYLGGGIGLAVPHVDAQVIGAANRTYGFETTGLALRGIAGLKYAINERWALFGEYQITWSDNDATLDPDPTVPGQLPGKLRTEIVTHAVNFGVSYSF
ncbi:MAG: outer membrane beta-barrel protein [Roseovarius sp.]|nr:outer membrane beta-barrel protein [Roseovarius sp.]